MPHYDLVIAYRIYPGVSKQPFIFADDKYKLSDMCIHSLQQALGTVNARVYALLDGCPPEYEALFRYYFPGDNLRVINLDRTGNAGTFSMQIDLLLQQEESEYIYFAEDDYLYRPQCFDAMLRFIKNNPHNSIVTPFDHLDYYQHPLHTIPCQMMFMENHHWRTAISTCLTFLTTKETLRKTKDVFLSYANGNWDVSLFFALTKAHVRNPLSFFKFLRTALQGKNEFLKILAQSWFHNSAQIVFGKRYTIWSPIPSMATHLQYDDIAPGVNWEDEAKHLIR